MHFARIRAEIGNAAGDTVIKARADVDHQIAAMHRQIGLIKPVHAQHAQPRAATCRISAKPHQRRGDRKAGCGDKFAQQIAGLGARVDHAAAGVEHRPLGGFHHLDHRRNRVAVAFDLRLVMADLGLCGRLIFTGGKLHILWDVDQHGPRTTRARDMEGLVQGFGQLVGVFHQPVMLGAGPRDADCIGLLERI